MQTTIGPDYASGKKAACMVASQHTWRAPSHIDLVKSPQASFMCGKAEVNTFGSNTTLGGKNRVPSSKYEMLVARLHPRPVHTR